MVMNKIYMVAMNNIKKEFFPSVILTEKFKSEETVDSVSTIAMIMTIFLAFIYFTVMLGLWIRIVYYAFKNGVGEGISAIFFYKLYVMYFVGSTISLTNKVVM